MSIRSIRVLFALTMILLLTSCEKKVEKTIEEPNKATESRFHNNTDLRASLTSKDLTKADLAWHAVNSYGWDCEEISSKGEMKAGLDYFFIECSSGLKLRVYLRKGQHPKITNENGKYN